MYIWIYVQGKVNGMKSVTTKEELNDAVKAGVPEIVIVGDLADKVARTKKLGMLSGWRKKVFLTSIASATAATAAIPLTGGSSTAAVAGFVAPAAALSGMEIAAIIISITIGAGMLIGLHKDYEEIEVGNGKLVLRKKQKK
jgi:hypothetical protein